jgi:molecular chaperone GrpE
MDPHLDSATTSAAGETPEAGAARPESPDETAGLEKALAAKTQEVERLVDRLARLQAEFENFRKRMVREKAEFLKFANDSLLLELLPVLDNLERALGSARAEASPAALADGIEMIVRLFQSTLEKFGVKPMEAAGKPFDPSLHQAVAQVESPDGSESLVVDEIQKGYWLEGRVLRAAMVRVSRAAATGSVDAAAGEGSQA